MTTTKPCQKFGHNNNNQTQQKIGHNDNKRPCKNLDIMATTTKPCKKLDVMTTKDPAKIWT